MSSFNIQDLPIETQLEIFHYVSFVDYFRCVRRVCSLWRALVDDIVSRLSVLNLANAFNANKTLTLMGPRLKSLRELNLSRCVSLSDKAFIPLINESCDSLVHVDISKCHLLTDASINALLSRHVSSLTVLKLDGCTNFTSAGLAELLSKTTALQSLSLRKLKYTVWASTPLVALDRLNLSACAGLTDATLVAYAEAATRLTELRIAETRVSAAGIISAVQLLRELRVLSMSFCNAVNNDVLSQLAAHCDKLHTLEIESCTQVQDAGIIAVSRALTQLGRLNVNCCYQLTGNSMAQVHVNCPRLVYLDVKGCQSIDRGVLAKMKETRSALKIIGM